MKFHSNIEIQDGNKLIVRNLDNTLAGEIIIDANGALKLTPPNGKPAIINGLTITPNATGFGLAGGTTLKTLTVNNTITLSGTDGSTLNVGAGGTLGSAAFTASTAYAASAHNHDASNINAGTLADARIPSLDMSKISTGSLTTDRLTEPAYMLGTASKTARPLFDVLRADRTAFLPADQIIVEKSTDGGATWVDAGYSDANKKQLFTGQRPTISIPLKNGIRNTDCMMRVTITGMKYNVPNGTPEIQKYDYWSSSFVTANERYFSVSEGWAFVSAVSDRIHCKVEKATGADSTNWILDREAFMYGWSGGNYFSLGGGTFGGGTSQTGNTWNWRFTFRTATTSNDFDNAKLSASYNTYEQAIYHIKISGPNVWVTPNNLMYNDHLYSWNEDKSAIFPNHLSTSGALYENWVRVYSPNNKPTPADIGALASTHDANAVTAAKITNWDGAYTHSTSSHAPTNAQKNSDITKAEIEAKLTGAITTHTHAYLADNHAASGVTSGKITNWDAAYTHSASSHLALGTTSTTAFRGDQGLTAYNHSQAAHAPSNADATDYVKIMALAIALG